MWFCTYMTRDSRDTQTQNASAEPQTFLTLLAECVMNNVSYYNATSLGSPAMAANSIPCRNHRYNNHTLHSGNNNSLRLKFSRGWNLWTCHLSWCLWLIGERLPPNPIFGHYFKFILLLPSFLPNKKLYTSCISIMCICTTWYELCEIANTSKLVLNCDLESLIQVLRAVPKI